MSGAISLLPTTRSYGRDAQDRLAATEAPDLEGARAALETFYFAFNAPSLSTLGAVWLDEPTVQLNNPVGGILRGIGPITELYTKVFSSADVWVELSDIIEMSFSDTVVFAGRERGEFARDGVVVPLEIRTSRVFVRVPAVGWRQVHHHGSIDDPDLLGRYQAAVRGEG